MKDLTAILQDIVSEARKDGDWGRVADYIPQLAGVDPRQFGIAVVLPDGTGFAAGDAHVPFSAQSITKVFTLALALGRAGDQLWQRVGREPSGRAFNSIVQLEQEHGRPRNPFINAGAIVVTDEILAGREPRETLGELLRFVRDAADDGDIHINETVAKSELAHGHRNFALAHFMASQGNLKNTPDRVLGTYFHQCAIEMTTLQLAHAGRFLLEHRDAPRLVSDGRIRRLNALMMTCGHYDGSGEFAYQVGLPAKSGVGGGILAVVPRKASIAVWSPGLNAYGNSLKGTAAMARLARAMNWSVF